MVCCDDILLHAHTFTRVYLTLLWIFIIMYGHSMSRNVFCLKFSFVCYENCLNATVAFFWWSLPEYFFSFTLKHFVWLYNCTWQLGKAPLQLYLHISLSLCVRISLGIILGSTYFVDCVINVFNFTQCCQTAFWNVLTSLHLPRRACCVLLSTSIPADCGVFQASFVYSNMSFLLSFVFLWWLFDLSIFSDFYRL